MLVKEVSGLTEGERLKAIREAKGMTLKEFGTQIGITDSAVSQMEKGRINMSEQTKILVCNQFNVREEWLRDGLGEMFVEQNVDALLGQFFGEISRDDDGSFRKRLITALAKLGPRDWAAIADFAEKIINARSE